MRPFLLVALLVFAGSQLSEPKQQKHSPAPQPTAPDQRGTEQSPLVVKTLPPTKTKGEAEQETKDRSEKTANDRNLVSLTGILAVVGSLQLLVFGYQAYKLRETVESAGKQSEAMERHIGEAARSATAMESIATVIQDGNKAIIRAYLTVIVGQAIWQERHRGGKPDLKFEARPLLQNTGNTPARKVIIRICSDILAVPVPANFEFPLPDEPTRSATGTVGAHQTSIMACTVNDFVPDMAVASIKEGLGRALCVWGLVNYEDIFGDSHTTKFGQVITWMPDNSVMGYFIDGQNDGD